MKAVVLAGGKGTRLAPYTMVFPKPLVPIGNRPILDIIIRQLAYYGFKDIVLTVGHLSELIRAYFSSGRCNISGVQLSYVDELKPSGTAGSLGTIPGLNSTFLVMNGDLLTTLNFRKLIRYHNKKGAAITIAMHKKHIKIDLGVMEVDHNGFLISYNEKPEKTYDVSMGIYVYEPRVLKYIKKGKYLDFPHLVQRLLDNGERIAVYHSNDFWRDIGNHDDFEKAQIDFENMKSDFLPSEKKKR